MIDGLGRVFYYVVSRAKTLVNSVKKVTQPKYVIIFTIAYPYIYKNIKYILDVIPQVVVNLAEQLYSWIQATFWDIYNYISNNVNLGPLTGPVAGLVAGMAMAYPYLFYLFMKHILSFFVWVMAQIALNVMGAIAYIFCNVVIPAIKYIAGGYLFWRFLPHTFRYIGRALDRFGRGSLSGALGALAATLTPLAGFTLGYTVVSMLTDPACGSLGSPFVNLGYAVPYISYTPYSISLPDSMSAIGNLLTGYGYVIPSYYLTSISYLENLIYTRVTYLLSMSYIYQSILTSYLGASISYIYPFLNTSILTALTSYISNMIYVTASPYYVVLPYYTPTGTYYYFYTPGYYYYQPPQYPTELTASYSYIYNFIHQIYMVSLSYIQNFISIYLLAPYVNEMSVISLAYNTLNALNYEYPYIRTPDSVVTASLEWPSISTPTSLNITAFEMPSIIYTYTG